MGLRKVIRRLLGESVYAKLRDTGASEQSIGLSRGKSSFSCRWAISC